MTNPIPGGTFAEDVSTVGMTYPVAGGTFAEDVSTVGMTLGLGSLGPFGYRVFCLAWMV